VTYRQQLIFWTAVLIILTLFFGGGSFSFPQAFYFVCMLLPVAVITSWFFNEVLVARYLLNNRIGRFILYFVYSFIISLWLQMLVVTAALILIANYNVANLGPFIRNVQALALIIYLIVFVQAFIQLIVRLRGRDQGDTSSKSQEELVMIFRVNRKNYPIKLHEILYVESRTDYIEIQTKDERHVTRERISHLNDRLPDTFIRVHRSFIVNSRHVSSFTMEEVRIDDHLIPVGRKFRGNLQQLKPKHESYETGH